jgi:4-amino-4-deoxy-L-arabinose transferase-like glycosyltransferase
MENIEIQKKESKKKILEWLSNKNNLYLVLIIAFAVIVRLYYFFLTKDQAVWWDEAEYLVKAKSLALGTPDTGFWPGRPVLFPLMLSAFYFLSLGEVSIRFVMLFVSIASVYLVYLVGRKMFGERVGLISSFLYSLVYINLFYSMRIMTDIPHVTLGLLAFYFFLTKKPKLVWFVVPILALATLIRFPAFFFFVILLIYVAVTEKLSALKNRDYWISAGLAALIAVPYMIWSWIKYGHPLYAVITAGGGSIGGITLSSAMSVLKEYIYSFPMYLHSLLLVMFLIGIFYLFEIFIGFDLLWKGGNEEISYKFLTLLWIVIPLAYFGFGVSHYEDRYIFMAFPAIFFMLAFSIDKISSYIRKYSKFIAIFFVIIVLAIGGYQLLSHSDTIIKEKIPSFEQLKETGSWIKEHTGPSDKIMIRSHPQNTYYSERESYTISTEENDFVNNFSEINPKYVVFSLFDSPQDSNWWGYNFSHVQSKYNLALVKAIPDDSPIVVIFEKAASVSKI